MKEINPVELINSEDLSKERNIDTLLAIVSIENEKEIVLDIRKCYIDYPTTGRLLNKILLDLSQKDGRKKLKIIYDFHLPEFDLLACLFDESSFFGSTNFKQVDFESVKKIIEEKLNENSISISIELHKLYDPEIKHLNYGVE